MSRRDDYGQVGAAAFMASLSGVTIITLVWALYFAFTEGPADGLTVLLYAPLIGGVIALVTAWPLGWLIGCLMLRFGAISAGNAALSGALTGTTLVLLAFSGTLIERPNEAAHVFSVTVVFAALGAISGLIGYGLTMRRTRAE